MTTVRRAPLRMQLNTFYSGPQAWFFLADERGWLRSDYTTDGLHPDYLAKKSMGEKIGQYLEATFPWVTQSLTKKTNS